MTTCAMQGGAGPIQAGSSLRTLVAAALLAAGILGAAGPARAQQRITRFRAAPAAQSVQAAPTPAVAAGTNHSWDVLVSTVQKGKKLTVTLKQADPAGDVPDKRATLQGELLGIDGGSLTLRQAGAPRVIPASDVFRVRYAGVRERHVVRGLVAGVVLGGVGVWAADSRSANPEPGSALGMGAFFGGALGAIVGAAIPVSTLYEASDSAP